MPTVFRSVIFLILLAEFPFVPRLLIAPAPRPPVDAAETGLVILDMDINSSGKTSAIETVQGMLPFVEPSLEAARQWEFQALRKGQAAIPVATVFMFRARTLLPD